MIPHPPLSHSVVCVYSVCIGMRAASDLAAVHTVPCRTASARVGVAPHGAPHLMVGVGWE